ncbi:DNA-dependent ATPase protein rad54 [Coemansia sp. RSA 1822]|nr:DNA-dependent ATPase protein rad54 [Coemansia sp. RSA 638]KAJ2122947.1 DNA-dependent ATPase protein rad54 [Coemansia sp. RSA 720]KAJ2539792.1 DNA-dependent ATPase protein rad54 [Coemansia sp. RSA 1853]KAJ2563408.1 DNA-dependent ATPase protein rad54 [Coemansia sp. RSA 1822]
MSSGVTAEIPNRRLFKPFVSPAKNKPNAPLTRQGGTLKRAFSARKAIMSPPKRRRQSDDETDETDETEKDECMPGINYNGLSKKLFKPFRPPVKRAEGEEVGPDVPIVRGSLGVRRRMAVAKGPRYNPDTEDAVVLYRPPEPSQCTSAASDTSSTTPTTPQRQNKSLKSLLGISSNDPTESIPVAVVVDPVLGRKLRPHQIDGVQFLYNCSTGLVYPNAFGSIMADEMGLGKTLQCIALMWTLLKQSPVAGKPTIEKCIVACPSSLVKNWANEIVKWLGSTKIAPLACDNRGTKDKVARSLRSFMAARGRMVIHPVLIISYETLRTHIGILGASPIGLLLCDEGHRLKNSASQTYQALNMLQVQRRVILSGTPIQNDLSEYFSLLNFTNPGLLGTTQEFRRTYELPILRGRDSMATDNEQKKGDQQLAQLNAIASKVIIRRTNDLLAKYLPVKYEHVVFCPLTELQTDLYELFLKSKDARAAIGEGGKCSLQTIINLGKLCNHPGLLDLGTVPGHERVMPDSYYTDSVQNNGRGRSGGRVFHPKWSSKMMLLDRMLQQLSKAQDKEKMVVISNYTQTLDLIEVMCRARGFGHYRLDGAMAVSKRQTIVDQFNNPRDPSLVFLLSSKAGGCGINLVGASRLVLFDSSFNPADNLQACGRIWRDGQRKPCFIYTLATTGTVEEKIFQRQAYKTSLSACVVDEQENVERHFSRDQMRRLFVAKLRGTTECETHDEFVCTRCVKGRHAIKAPMPMDFADHNTWDHFSSADCHKLTDTLLKKCMSNNVSFVFQFKSYTPP